METTYDFDRFIAAQDPVYDAVVSGLKNGTDPGARTGYFFPGLAGLETRPTGYFDLRDPDEARAYLAHPVLGRRLIECTKPVILNAMAGNGTLFSPETEPAFHSSMTLFSRVKGASPVFESVMYACFGGVGDPAILKILRRAYFVSLGD
jgi:uncharacterized protein (DUF1810 family)